MIFANIFFKYGFLLIILSFSILSRHKKAVPRVELLLWVQKLKEYILENEKNRKNVHDRVDLLSLAADEIDNNERNYADSDTL